MGDAGKCHRTLPASGPARWPPPEPLALHTTPHAPHPPTHPFTCLQYVEPIVRSSNFFPPAPPPQVFFPYTMSAVLLADLGLDPYRIDALVAGKFGMPMGPFRWVRRGVGGQKRSRSRWADEGTAAVRTSYNFGRAPAVVQGRRLHPTAVLKVMFTNAFRSTTTVCSQCSIGYSIESQVVAASHCTEAQMQRAGHL